MRSRRPAQRRAALLGASGTRLDRDRVLLALRPSQQLVDNLVRELAADVIRHALKDPRRGRRQLA